MEIENFECYEERAQVGHCVWEYTGSEWTLYSDHRKEGGIPAPPEIPGQFAQQLLSTPCIATGKAVVAEPVTRKLQETL